MSDNKAFVSRKSVENPHKEKSFNEKCLAYVQDINRLLGQEPWEVTLYESKEILDEIYNTYKDKGYTISYDKERGSVYIKRTILCRLR